MMTMTMTSRQEARGAMSWLLPLVALAGTFGCSKQGTTVKDAEEQVGAGSSATKRSAGQPPPTATRVPPASVSSQAGASSLVAVDAGTKAPTTSQSESASKDQETTVAASTSREPSRLCQKDSDCTLHEWPPLGCRCSPCGDVKREAINKRTAKKLQASWARRRCRRPANCKECTGRYVGDTVVCENRQCAVR